MSPKKQDVEGISPTTSITLRASIKARIDKLAEKVHATRSEVIEEFCKHCLRLIKDEEIDIEDEFDWILPEEEEED